MIFSHKRAALKSLSWRLWSTSLTTLVVGFYSGNWILASTVAAGEWVFKTLIFYFHELFWNWVIRSKVHSSGVIWLTGLSGSGKSTLAESLYRKIKGQGFSVVQLDGDNLRKVFNDTAYDKLGRVENVLRAGAIASHLEDEGFWVIASLVSPDHGARSQVRKMCKNFYEIYLSTPVEICEARDPKKIYYRARKGELKNVIGIHEPYQASVKVELEIDTSSVSENEAVEKILSRIHLFKKKSKDRHYEKLSSFST